MDRAFQEALFNIRSVRWIVATAFICRGAFFLLAGNRYRGISDFCWVVRVSGVGPLHRVADAVVRRMVQTILRDGRNTLIDSYRSDRLSVTCAEEYSIAGHGSRDIFRDMIVLKHATAREKGVILLKYTRTFEAVVSLFDLSRLRDRYLFVLEPCWAGYCDPSILLFIAHGHPVVIQCFTEADYQFIESIGTPLVPVRLGPADWVDADLFTPVQTDTKPYDLVMVANWASHKRHAQLFRALSGVNGRQLRVLLIGFPWGGRTASDIRREAAAVKNDLIQIDVIEQVPPRDVARYVSQCKVFVFLSRKEGDNKALVEAMFADVPAIVFDKTIGGARNRINRSTGIFSSDEDLRRNILYMLDHYQEFSPRAWALQHTGSSIATGILNGVVKRMVIDSGGKFTEDLVEKTNSPNLAYKDSTCRLRFQADYEFILSSRRESLRSRKT